MLQTLGNSCGVWSDVQSPSPGVNAPNETSPHLEIHLEIKDAEPHLEIKDAEPHQEIKDAEPYQETKDAELHRGIQDAELHR